ncbi:aromatic acid exporter family protein, partial [uncultured Trichococcus sp.]
MTLSHRTIKIAFATVIAILIAQLLNLNYSVSAGIIAILSVLDTKKSSVLTALQRIASTVLALTIATVLFRIFGFHIIVFGV